MKTTFEDFLRKQHVDNFGLTDIKLEAFLDSDGHFHLSVSSPDGWTAAEYSVTGNALELAKLSTQEYEFTK